MLLALAASANPRNSGMMTRFGSSEDLLESCKKVERLGPDSTAPAKDALDAGSCLGFIAGVIDAEDYYHVSFREKTPQCIPNTVTGAQLAKVIVKHGNDHPEGLHYAAVDLLHSALMLAFPCK